MALEGREQPFALRQSQSYNLSCRHSYLYYRSSLVGLWSGSVDIPAVVFYRCGGWLFFFEK